MVNVANLHPGDLIFTVQADKSGHVAMYMGIESGTAMQIHAIHTEPTEARKGRNEITFTSLRSSPDLQILRCKDVALARKAVTYAKLWSKYEMPFSERRVQQAMAYEWLGPDAMDRCRGLFASKGKFRAIKYTARRNGILTYPGETHDGAGMFCSMFVIVCYQVAGLDPYVVAADPGDFTVRVSDKKMDNKQLRRLRERYLGQLHDYNDYVTYCQNLHETNPYELTEGDLVPAEYIKTVLNWGKGTEKQERLKEKAKKKFSKRFTFIPSVNYWRYGNAGDLRSFDFAGAITAGMMVDAKVTMPEPLRRSLMDDDTGWSDLGTLTGAAAFDKENYTAVTDLNRVVSERLRNQYRTKKK